MVLINLIHLSFAKKDAVMIILVKRSASARAFTLIELLIVVAIIAILAAIAVPNFLEAQTRAKVSRIVSDLRVYDTGIEIYRIDHNSTPPTRRFAGQTRTWLTNYITTPIAYINQAFPDVFNNRDTPENAVLIAWGPDYMLTASEPRFARAFRGYPVYSDGTKLIRRKFFYVFSAGPDQIFDFNGPPTGSQIFPYDASNGTISKGDIGRFNG